MVSEAPTHFHVVRLDEPGDGGPGAFTVRCVDCTPPYATVVDAPAVAAYIEEHRCG